MVVIKQVFTFLLLCVLPGVLQGASVQELVLLDKRTLTTLGGVYSVHVQYTLRRRHEETGLLGYAEKGC